MAYRGYTGYGRIFVTGGERRPPVRPKKMPSIDDLPIYTKPFKPGAGRFKHPTERSGTVRRSIRRFSKQVLGFESPQVREHHAWTGNVDFVVLDTSKPKGRQPCARFEIKSAARYKKDIHAQRGRRRRRPGRRAGTYEIDPKQHFAFLEQSKRGGCGLFYVLVPRRGEKPTARVEHVGICTLPMIEDILETDIRARRSVHREVGFECPDVKTWIRWKKEL